MIMGDLVRSLELKESPDNKHKILRFPNLSRIQH
jgi:hypothetical protein